MRGNIFFPTKSHVHQTQNRKKKAKQNGCTGFGGQNHASAMLGTPITRLCIYRVQCVVVEILHGVVTLYFQYSGVKGGELNGSYFQCTLTTSKH